MASGRGQVRVPRLEQLRALAADRRARALARRLQLLTKRLLRRGGKLSFGLTS